MSVELTQSERDDIALELKIDGEQARKLQKAYNADPELWRAKSITAAVADTIAQRGFSDMTSATMALETYKGKVRALSRPTDTELERSLVEHVALCLLRLQVIELAFPQRGNLALLDFWNKNLAAAQRRFLNACTTLARVRRLALPVVQVNIGDKQMNIAQVNSSKG
jgi:hypothetical protein